MKPPRTYRGESLERKILGVLENGKRAPQFCAYFAPNQKEYQRAVGALVLRGLILFKGRTRGRVMTLNGRRRKA